MERKMLTSKPQDKVPCLEIRKRAKTFDIIEYTLKQKWKWVTHIARMKYNRWTKCCSLLVGCSTSHQHAGVSQGPICRQLYVLPHWDRSCRSNFLPHPVTVYWHWADQSQSWPYIARHLDESIKWGLVCAYMHSVAWTQKILTFMS